MAKPLVSPETEQTVLVRQQGLCAECGNSFVDERKSNGQGNNT